MATNFPNGVDNFPIHTDNNNEKVRASDVNNIQDGLKATQQKVLDMQTSIDDAVDAVDVALDNALIQVDNKVGTLANLTTTDKDSVVDAINEVNTKITNINIQLNNYSSYASGKDSNDIYTIVDYKRADNTLYMKSTLSGGTSPLYTTNTWQFYNNAGTVVTSTVTWTISYDIDGNIVSKVVS